MATISGADAATDADAIVAMATMSGSDAGRGADAAATASLWPFGEAKNIARFACPVVLPGGGFRSFLAVADTKVAFVDGDDWLALVNRSPTGALPPDYVPADLVDLHDLSPRSAAACESAHACLRRDAAVALQHLFDAMRLEGMQARVESAFRAFQTQCWVFSGWAAKAHAGFCEATTQSALPGHSQHQLGTTVDMFTNDWAFQGAVFRDGFGCTRAGKWLDENAWRYGYVVSYPIDPDDRKDGSRCAARWDRPVPIDPKTGYKHEPWHLRFIGVGEASRFHDAWLASDPGSPGEITLEQWLRSLRGLVGDTELPVCDGCACGACATLAADGDKAPCGDASLQLDTSGRPVAPPEEPHIVDATAKATGTDGEVLLEVTVHAAPHTPTQPPVVTQDGPAFEEHASFEALVPYPGTKPHRYPDLPGAWRVGVEPADAQGAHWPWRASLAKPSLAVTWNRANLVLPAQPGDATTRLRIAVPKDATALRVTLLRDGDEHGTREVPVVR
jgi:D-alanyl-D-alanine carboxypeptidase